MTKDLLINLFMYLNFSISSLIPFIIIISALLFKLRSLQIKKLQEKGSSSLAILYLHRLAIIPSFIFLLFTFKFEYLQFFLQNPKILTAIVFSICIWIIMEYIGFFIMGSAQSLTFLQAFRSIISLPIYLVVGVLINNDTPHILTGVAILLLVLAMFLQPQQHEEKVMPVFKHGIVFIIFIALIGESLDAIGNGLYRYILNNIGAIMFYMAFSSFFTTGLINIFFLFKPVNKNDLSLISQNKFLAYSQPIIWFLASIPEAVAFMYAPIYSIAGIRSLSFIIDIISDIKNKRIKPSVRTIGFLILVFIGVSLLAYSL